LQGISIVRWPVHRRIAAGIGFVSEERSVFMGLTALDNLRLGRGDVDAALATFPELKSLLHRRAGLLSGGEQQMLTLGRALAARPDVLLVDELSLGLAPMVTQRLMDALRAAASTGVGVLVVEQQARLALDVVDRAYVLSRGEVVLEAPAADLRDHPERLEELYLAHHSPTE
jgi:branched-chain amino acid transport system ATP-binding protein